MKKIYRKITIQFTQREWELLEYRVNDIRGFSGEEISTSEYIRWVIARHYEKDADINVYGRDRGFLFYGY